MKKMMIALAAVAMTVAVQAATVSWSTVAMYNDKEAKVADKATVYVYLIDGVDAYNKLTDIWGAYGADITAGGTGANASKTTGKYTHKVTIDAPGTASPNTTYYAAIIATIGAGDDMKYYAEKAAVTTGDDGAGGFTMGGGVLDSAAAAAGAWKIATTTTPEGVPEPTSGLLMALGLAGLALRRRRA